MAKRYDPFRFTVAFDPISGSPQRFTGSLVRFVKPGSSSYTLVREEHPTNFGHEGVVIKGDVHFPERDER